MSTTIPHPDNPVHVDNLRSIALLKSQSFKGSDASLAESVIEYGLCWRELNDCVLFVYKVREPNVFDRCTTVRKSGASSQRLTS